MEINQPAGYYNELYFKAKSPLGFFHRHRVNSIIKHVPENSSVLDLGCSAGLTGLLLKGKNCESTGVDNREECISYAKKDSVGTFLCADIKTLDLHKQFDVVVCSDVIEHFDKNDREQVLKVADRHLRNKGVLIFTVPGFFEHSIEPVWKLIRRVSNPGVVFDDEGVHELVTIEELERVLGVKYKIVHRGVTGIGLVNLVVFTKLES